MACQNAHVLAAKVLLAHGADVAQARVRVLRITIIEVLFEGATAVFMFIRLEATAGRLDRSQATRGGATALIVASWDGLNRPSPRISETSRVFEYPATCVGHVEIVALLLTYGADPSLSWNGRTPIDIAIDNEHANVAESLRQALRSRSCLSVIRRCLVC